MEYKFLIEEFLIQNVCVHVYKKKQNNIGTHYSLKSNGIVMLKIPSFIMGIDTRKSIV